MVRIAAARVIPVRLRFVRPVRTARGIFTERDSFILELRDTDGCCGYGEAAPWPGFATETADSALAALQDVARYLVGSEGDPGEPVAVGEAAGLNEAPAARAAVQGAMWDLLARAAGSSLAAHLASSVRSSCGPALREVPCSALLLGCTPEELLEEARRVRDSGYRAAKIKLGAGTLEEDVARARASRAGLGAAVALRGDANGAWSERSAAEALAALSQFGFEYIEQPLPPEDVDGLARLRGRAHVPIAADESVSGEDRAARLVAAAAVDVMVLKPVVLGGPGQALAIAAAAHSADMAVVFSHAFESAVGARHVLACAAAWGDPDTAHGLSTDGLFENDVAAAVPCRGGVAVVPDAPGLGIDL